MLFYATQDIDVSLLERPVLIFLFGLQRENIQFQSIGTGILHGTCEVCPFRAAETVDTGNDGNGTEAFGLLNQVNIFFDGMRTNIGTQVISCFGRIISSHVMSLHHDLFFKNRFQHDGSGTGQF